MQTFGYDIKKLAQQKAELGMLDCELARLANVAPSTVKNVLTRQTTKPTTIKKIADALGVPMSEIVIPVEQDLVTPAEPAMTVRRSI